MQSTTDGKRVINGKPICRFAERDPSNIPWGREGVEYTIELVDCKSEYFFY